MSYKQITPDITEIKTGTPAIKVGDKYVVGGIGGNFIPGGTLSGGGGGGGADITLGQIDADGNFQALAFNGTEASNSGSPETVESYYGWNGVLPVPNGGIKVYTIGDAVYYKCTDVNASSQKWSGKLAVFDSENKKWSISDTVVTDLDFSIGYTPVIGKIYSGDALVRVSELVSGIPIDGLVFQMTFDGTSVAADTGQYFTQVVGSPEFTIDSGIPCCRMTDSSRMSGNNGIGLPVGRSSRTLSVWLKTSNTSQGGYVFSYGTAEAGQYFGLYTSNGNIYFAASSNSNSVRYPLTADTWIHIVGVYENDILKMYANGVFYGEAAFPSQLETVFTGYSISGQYDREKHYFDGLVAGCRIYNRALSAEEVAMLYSEFTPTA